MMYIILKIGCIDLWFVVIRIKEVNIRNLECSNLSVFNIGSKRNIIMKYLYPILEFLIIFVIINWIKPKIEKKETTTNTYKTNIQNNRPCSLDL